MTAPRPPVPVTVITGFLGSGKTTAILDLFKHRPEDQKWAILVNEFGKVGIDGAILQGEAKNVDGLSVQEVRGGCICCTAGIELKVALVRILRDVRPDRLLIETSGVSQPATVLDPLRAPGLRDSAEVRATLALVDLRRMSDPRTFTAGSFHGQIQVADVLVGTHDDLATDADRERFRAFAAEQWPPKTVALVSGGKMDPAWLDLVPTPKMLVRTEHRAEDTASLGWVWPAEVVFDRSAAETAIQGLVRPNPALPAGVLRAKGILRTPRAWLRFDAEPDRVTWQPTGYRSDSRVEFVVPAEPAPDEAAVEAIFAALVTTLPDVRGGRPPA